MQQPIILASTSTTRQNLLTAAGITFNVIPSAINEESLKQLQPELSSTEMAAYLATEKASSVASLHPDSIIIGADQILQHNNLQLSKPKTIAEARTQLQNLRGSTHTLYTSVTCVRGTHVLWQHTAKANLTMRNFSDQYLDHYLADCAQHVLSSVGAYQIEHHGIRLFEKIEGDHTTILGLPIIPLLTFLHCHKFITS
jgi:septum formation protein